MGFRLAPSYLTFDDLEGSKIKVILFDVKYAKNGNSYDVGPIGFILEDIERLKVKVRNGAVTAIGMWDIRQSGQLAYLLSPHADRHGGDISFTVCLFVCFCVRRIFGNGYLVRWFS